EAAQQPGSVACLFDLGALGAERMGAVADARELGEHAASVEITLAPVDREPAVGEVETRVENTAQRLEAAPDAPGATPARHPFYGEIDVGSAVAALDIEREVEVFGHGGLNAGGRGCANGRRAHRRAPARARGPIGRRQPRRRLRTRRVWSRAIRTYGRRAGP